MKSINPATEQVVAEFVETSCDEVSLRIGAADDAFRVWRKTPTDERAARMDRVAELLKAKRSELARLMTDEMGKTIASAEAEIDKCALVCSHYAAHAAEMLSPREVKPAARRSYVCHDPLGVVLAVMPWNFPFWQVFRFLAPGLMVGNTALLKHASNVCGCALAIERLIAEAGFPAGAFASLLIPADRVEDVIAHPAVRGVSLTGSERAGESVAAAAGAHLKKSVLELGGSDPFIVLSDADIESTAARAAEARTINAGQSCIAAKRFIVDRAVVARFTEALCEAMQRLKVGDPLDRANHLGPLARGDLVKVLQDQVERTLAAGAKLVCGGKLRQGVGYFYPPTVISGINPGMAVFDEETFGPVAPVIAAVDENEAIELANRSDYGLGASIWTSDPERAERLVPHIEAGSVFINDVVKSDPRLPFGGVKRSGYGRELSDVGFYEFTNIKTVSVG